MNEEQARELLARYRQGNCTEEERIAVEAWIEKEVTERTWDISPEDKVQFGQSLKNRIDLIRHAMPEPDIHSLPQRTFKLWPRIAAAAILILSLSAGIFFLNRKQSTTPLVVQNQIKPGSNMAILTLAGGKRIVLNTAANGTLVTQTGLKITKTADGQLVYSPTGDNNSAIEYNTVETPKGGQYRVELADGTIAWLNAASSLKYPNHFNGSQRIVELTGEAYFEVAKDKAHPFIVKSSRQSVEVLGTHFNINTYEDESTVKSTLLEGSVKVTENSTGKSELLKPGQQAQLTASKFKVVEANTEEAIAWKNGYFKFNDEKIQSIMRKIARWYDVKVEYKGEITDEGFNGAITRFGDINDVLNIMQRSKAVHFKIEGRRIIVEK